MNAFTELLSRKNELTKLSINKVKLPLKTVSELGTALSADYCSIVELYLQGCSIGDVGFAKINKSLRQIKTIHKLDLSDCALSNASIIMLVDTLRIKSLDANETKWIGNLRDDHLVPKKQLGVLILNDNTKIQNSIVELLEAMANEDVTCLETLEIRNCYILSEARMNQALTRILQEPPELLETFDIRQNPILQTMESKTLIQLLMTKLLTSHPNAEYFNLSGVSETDLGATKTISKKTVQRKTKKVLNVPKGLKTDESDGDFNIDDQYQELPNNYRKEIETIDLLKERLKYAEEGYSREASKREETDRKYSELSSRIVKLENIIDSKNEKIIQLEKEKEGCILVEESLLKHVETSFGNFQSLLNKLHELGLGELAAMADGSELYQAPAEENLEEIRSRLLSDQGFTISSDLS